MKLYQRVRHVLAQEGFSGVGQRIARRCRPKPSHGTARCSEPDEDMIRAKEAYMRLSQDFEANIQARAYGDLSHYYWYHTVDLGNGLVTPGDYDFRDVLPAFQFPEDMSGMTVLDVGSATGFFSFEFEKRGATVIAVDLPSLGAWDIIANERQVILSQLRAWHNAETAEQMDARHLDGPFQFCHKMLKSKVQKRFSSVYDLTPEKLGMDTFDLVFLGDVLLHLFCPLKALDVLASLCRGSLVIAQQLVNGPPEMPIMRYIAGAPKTDGRSWWLPNWPCLESMLRTVGFHKVSLAGDYTCVIRRIWQRTRRSIIYATK